MVLNGNCWDGKISSPSLSFPPDLSERKKGANNFHINIFEVIWKRTKNQPTNICGQSDLVRLTLSPCEIYTNAQEALEAPT